MPELKKKSISLYLKTDCERRFRLSMYGDADLKKHSLPPRQTARAGLTYLSMAGDTWQDLKVSEVQNLFGAGKVFVNSPKPGKLRPEPTLLESVMDKLQPFNFVVEAEYGVPAAFRAAYNLDGLTDEFRDPLISDGRVIPDLLQVLPPRFVPPSGKVWQAVDEQGNLTDLPPTDERLRLRVIDLKLTAEPGANYFAEVVHYSLILAAWLKERGYDDRFVVVAAGAVWPGSHDASKLAQKAKERLAGALITDADLATALEEDLETAEYSVFIPRLRRLLTRDLPRVLQTPWQDLQWHVDYRCLGCEFLGYPWKDSKGQPTEHPQHCWQVAEQDDHLSRVPGLTKGSAAVLRRQVKTVAALAALSPTDPAFSQSSNQGLKARGAVITARAQALVNRAATTIPNSGTSAVMPRWADLKIWVNLDFDPSSAITAVMSLRARWMEPDYKPNREKKKKTQRDRRYWGNASHRLVYVVDQRSVDSERREFLRFLEQLKAIMDEVRALDNKRAASDRTGLEQGSSYQIYLWDEAQLRQLIRMVGRHLPAIVANPNLRDLAWLFPSPELLAHPEDATRRSPITLVADAVESHVAVPQPHHYTLTGVVASYHPRLSKFIPTFDPYYQDPLSNLIPAERIHEYWGRTNNWADKQRRLEETSLRKTYALALISNRLEQDLRPTLAKEAAPPLSFNYEQPLKGVSLEGQLWYQYHRLNAASEELEAQVTYAMAAHEREARLKSAHLTQRIDDPARRSRALDLLNAAAGTQLVDTPDLLIYKLSPSSAEVNIRENAVGLALSPRSDPTFLHLLATPHNFPGLETYTSGDQQFRSVADADLTKVSLEAIDRQNLLIALRLDARAKVLKLESVSGVDFRQDVMLDQMHTDSLSKKLKLTIKAIGKPPSWPDNLVITRSLPAAPTPPARGGRRAPKVAWDYLYYSHHTYQQTLPINTAALQTQLEHSGVMLNPSQWKAWREALERRLSVIWGPPGTGKSQTLRAVVLGAVLDAQTSNRPLRVLVTANTYTAVDNVLLRLEEHYRSNPTPPSLFRIQSKFRTPDASLAAHTALVNIPLDVRNPGADVDRLRHLLHNPAGVLILGTTPQQLHNLAYAGETSNAQGHAIREWFDLVIIDEASQMDVATSTLIFSKVAQDGRVVLAGDNLQLPPIHPADPPKDLEVKVGSVYEFMTLDQGIPATSLDINYRSNETIVDFVRLAGYSPSLVSHSPQLRLHLPGGLPTSQPLNWPSTVPWSPAWGELLNPERPVTCFVYEDFESGQSNEFEAQAVTALIALLQGNLAEKPLGLRDASGNPTIPATTPYSPDRFWEHGVGIVTPHRAQVSKIAEHLTRSFAGSVAHRVIRSAVDTVERFQGQEREVIIASFGLGDPDVIRLEDDFLYSLNRFNVMASRARCKLIVLITQSLLDYLSDDQDVLRESALLKRFAEDYCRNVRKLNLPALIGGALMTRVGELRDL
ncbi:MAG: hypothetical protein KatS3mg075_745 [Meiothermus sp.]|nr:MAG: hypothetical protein KatS3mg075_745 [Meiothermus sp.]